MLAKLNSLNVHNLLIFQLILMILVSKFMVYRALSDKTYLSLGLLSPLTKDKLIELIERTFQREGSHNIACNDRNAFYSSNQPMVLSKCM